MEAVRRHKQILSLVSLVIAGDSGTIWGKSPKRERLSKRKSVRSNKKITFLE